MTAGPANLTAETNGDYIKNILYQDANFNPINLTGYTAKLQVRDEAGGVLLADLSAYVSLGGIAGTITINIPHAIIAGFTWQYGIYDLIVTSPATIAYPVLRGFFGIIQGATV